MSTSIRFVFGAVALVSAIGVAIIISMAADERNQAGEGVVMNGAELIARMSPQPTSGLGFNRAPPPTPKPLQPGMHEAPQPIAGLSFGNSWWDVVGDRNVFVYAGMFKLDHSQGIVYVVVDDNQGRHLPEESGLYRSPMKSGRLRIVGRDGLRFTLESHNGDSFVFDLGTRELTLATGTEALPLFTPSPAGPSPTPTPTTRVR